MLSKSTIEMQAKLAIASEIVTSYYALSPMTYSTGFSDTTM